MSEPFDRLAMASLHLAGLTVLLLLGSRLPGRWRAWGWRLTMLKAAILLVGVVSLPLLRPEPVATSPTVLLPAIMEDVPPATTPAPGLELKQLLALGWLAIGAILFARLGARQWSASRLVRESRPLADESGEASGRIRMSERVRAPMVAGLLRPCVLVPVSEAQPEGWDLAMAHERAHLRRRDLAWDFVLHTVACLFWFHPLAWIALREHRAACEEACDAEAIATTGCSAQRYAHALVTLGRPSTGTGLALGAPARALRRRIQAMHRRSLAPLWGLPLLLTAVGFGAPVELTAPEPSPLELAESRFDQVAAGLLYRPRVQKELGLPNDFFTKGKESSWPDETQRRIWQIGAMTAKMKEEGVPLAERVRYDNEEKQKLFAEVARRALARISPAQRRRLNEIALQWHGPLALREPAIAQAAGVSAKTRERIEQIRKEYDRASIGNQQAEFRKIRGHFEMGSGLSPADRSRYFALERNARTKGLNQAAFKEYQMLRGRISKAIGLPRTDLYLQFERAAWRRYSQKALAALSPSEAKGWRQLLGKPLPHERDPHLVY